ncbi:MAG: ABC transporter substrate-binding protein [Verrucomicrobia bacterium]|nr:ABC transporter substrate-binding protein [Verrucomicrobiota bacterium]
MKKHLLSSLAVFGLATAALAQGEIVVGEIESLTGGKAGFGNELHNASKLAVEEINAAGGLLGKKVVLKTEDTQSKPGEPAAAINKLISRDKVVAVLGEYASSLSLEAAPIAQQNKIPMISPGSTNPKVTEVGDYIFRICFIDPFQGVVISKFAQKTLKAKKAAVFTDIKADYSIGLAEFFKKDFTAAGGTVVAEKSYSTGDKDFKAQLTAIKASNPDFIMIPGYYAEVGLISKQARSLGITVPLIGGDGWSDNQLVAIGGSGVDGGYFTDHFSSENPDPKIQEFLKKYKAKYGKDAGSAAALGYDAANVLFDAIKRANSAEPAKIRDALAKTKDFPGITGKITLDDKRNATKPAVILQVKGKDFKFVEAVAP